MTFLTILLDFDKPMALIVPTIVDTIVAVSYTHLIMGWNTYHQIVTELSPDQWIYSSLQSYVITPNQIAWIL